MKKIWVVVANAVNANIFSISERERTFTLIKTLKHLDSMLKERDFSTERPGHYHKGREGARGSYEQTDHKTLEKEQFAREISDILEEGRKEQIYNSLIIVAEPHFYGLIRQHASSLVQEKIKYHLSKDYNHCTLKELTETLESSLAQQIRLLLVS